MGARGPGKEEDLLLVVYMKGENFVKLLKKRPPGNVVKFLKNKKTSCPGISWFVLLALKLSMFPPSCPGEEKGMGGVSGG